MILQRLFDRIAENLIEAAVYKNSLRLQEGLAGKGDLDLAVAAADRPKLLKILKEAEAVRALPPVFYDNAISSRQDWFLPLENGEIFHLDIACPVLVGRKFCKAYRLSWAASRLQGFVPLVSFEDETRLALARLAFNPTGPRLAREVPCSEDVSQAISFLLPAGSDAGLNTWSWQEGNQIVNCRFRREANSIMIESASLREVRRAVMRANKANTLAPARDAIVHSVRRLANGFHQRTARLLSSKTMAKRRLEKGTIIALIGPDGVGKSTQSKALVSHFGGKVASVSVYLGSNDGSWMRFRRKLFPLQNGSSSGKGSSTRSKRKRSWPHVHASALWRLVIAVQRRAAIARALRLARRGAIVVADRWPQTIEHGLMDGPSLRPPERYAFANLIWRFERRIYASMERFSPGLTIHLDCDFATSHRRKPGDISQEAFADRIALMEHMREKDDAIVIVDARAEQPEVLNEIIRHSWRHVSSIN